MKQFKLTDIEGKKFILHVPQETELRSRTPYVEPVEPPAPEIKEGMWVKINNKIRLVTKIDGDEFWLGYIDGNTKDGSSGAFDLTNLDGIRSATKEEIESHLQKVCEKYIGKKVKCMDTEELYFNLQNNHWDKYYAPSDQYWMTSENDATGVCVYEKGKFASIIESKKKRPETKEEFNEFLTEWMVYSNTVNSFLDKYDI